MEKKIIQNNVISEVFDSVNTAVNMLLLTGPFLYRSNMSHAVIYTVQMSSSSLHCW